MSIVKVLRSTTAGHTPGTLADGQIAINEADWILFWPDASGVTQSFNFKTPSANSSPSGGDNTTKLATTAFVTSAIAAIVNGAPSGLNTLNALAAAINNDATAYTDLNSAITNRIRYDSAQSLSGTQINQATANLGLFNRTSIGDASVTVLNTARELNITATLTAARTWTLPAASTMIAGGIIFIVDENGGSVGAANTLTFSANGSDKVNGASSFTINSPFRYMFLQCDGSSKWTLHQPGIHFDFAQSLTSSDTSGTASQQTQARENVYAAPFDAMGFSGLQVNGAMEVNQVSGSNAVTTTGSYIIDGVKLSFNTTSLALSGAWSTDAPPGYINSVSVTVPTAEATIGANDFDGFIFPIEGARTARLAWGTASAAPLSIAFWVKTNRTGTYSGVVTNSAQNESYPFTFTIAATGTWQFVTVTIKGATSGTWLTTNGVGLYVYIAMAVGTSKQGTAGAWSASNLFGATSSINGVASTSDYMRITGLLLLPGLEVPASIRAPFIMRPVWAEIPVAQRYRQSTYGNGVTPGNSSTGLPGMVNVGIALYTGSVYFGDASNIVLPTQMRAAPTITFWDRQGHASKVTLYFYDTTVELFDNMASTGAFNLSPTGFYYEATRADMAQEGCPLSIHYVLSAEL